MSPSNLHLIDLQPKADDFLGDVERGFNAPSKYLLPKYIYDAAGSQCFDEICQTNDYYLTRVERSIMKQLGVINLDTSKPVAVVELGGASSTKFRELLKHLTHVQLYMPVDISKELLNAEAEQLAADIPDLQVKAICADYQQLADFPWREHLEGMTPLLFFPGSTVGNLSMKDTHALMDICRTIVGDEGYMLMGADLVKDEQVLIRAYSDSEKVTERFNLNILHRMNRDLGGDIHVGQFRHEVRYNQAKKKIDIYLVSNIDQTVHIAGKAYNFKKDEPIYTESSRKFERSDIEALAGAHGLKLTEWWTDARDYFSVSLLKSVPLS
ncbi:MAG: L-histidine N(alpha)-methyltransferase [Deltaproteobacteria bacterium]|nr:L-histidine N(alpha)-methyltransferase [Deltaproteobacteria bacterium]